MRRVVLAGLIARKPKVLILDEPLAGLDPYAREEIVSLLAHLRRGGQTIVIISHDYDGLARVQPSRRAGGRFAATRTRADRTRANSGPRPGR